jgi:hypothetical protein
MRNPGIMGMPAWPSRTDRSKHVHGPDTSSRLFDFQWSLDNTNRYTPKAVAYRLETPRHELTTYRSKARTTLSSAEQAVIFKVYPRRESRKRETLQIESFSRLRWVVSFDGLKSPQARTWPAATLSTSMALRGHN